MDKKVFLLLHFALVAMLANFVPAKSSSEISIIPKPLTIERMVGEFRLNDSTKVIVVNGTRQLYPVAQHLAEHLRTVTGYPFQLVKSAKKKGNSIMLILDNGMRKYGREGYKLISTNGSVSISSVSPAGIFYGVQSLYQLLPPEVEKNQQVSGFQWQIPSVKIEDRPRFKWRGMHLDVGRHFAPVEFVKKYIDLLASYKMNIFHWHLTEDQGWRIKIDKYPRLTEIGSKRKETMGDGKPYGGFYTKEEVRDIVRYAKERYISIMPEIEMPGHSLAALAAYEELSCSGGPFEVGTTWGVFEDVYCAGNEKTFRFLKNVLAEITSLFPGKYFHIGGDECPKVRWEKCPKCQARIRKNRLGNENRLQSYFIKRIERFLNSKGKILVGWDEILEGGLPPRATVMSWRGTEGGIEAANSGHDVVMTPTSHCYFDYYQGAPASEPKAIGGFLPLDSVYSFDPVPSGLAPGKVKHILGAQGNVWTEWMPDTRQVEYMVLPRMLAMSEVVWSDRSQRDFDDFSKRLEGQYDRLFYRDFNFRVPPPGGIGGKRYIFQETRVEMKSPISSASIFYTLDGSDPNSKSKQYSSPIPVSNNQTLKAIVMLGNGRSSYPATVDFFLIDQKVNGLEYRYYEGELDSLPDFRNIQAMRKGQVYDINLEEINQRGDNFALQFIGNLRIEKEGEYTFYLNSDDGSKLFIDNRELINNNMLHPPRELSGKIFLSSQNHEIEVQYFQRSGGKLLELSFEGPGIPKQFIPPGLLIYP